MYFLYLHFFLINQLEFINHRAHITFAHKKKKKTTLLRDKKKEEAFVYYCTSIFFFLSINKNMLFAYSS